MENLSTAPAFSRVAITKKGRYTQNKRESNAYNRENAPSPVFSFQIEELTTGKEELLDFFQDKPNMKKYGAMTNVIIQNNSTQLLQVYLNQDRNRVISVPAGTIRSLEQNEIQGGVISLIVRNADSGTVNTNEVIVEVLKVGVEIESTFQKLYKKFSKIGGF